MPTAFDAIASGRSTVSVPQGSGTIQSTIGNLSLASGSACGGTGAEYVLAVVAIPGGVFDSPGSGIRVEGWGAFANNGNSKRVRLIFNPSAAVVGGVISLGSASATLADTLTGSGATSANTGFAVSGVVLKTGVFGSNTQVALGASTQIGAAAVALPSPAATTANEGGTILVALTGTASTTATDISVYGMQVTGIN